MMMAFMEAMLFISMSVMMMVAPLIGAQRPFVCEVCGCSYCDEGDFPVGNPAVFTPFPPQFLAPPGFAPPGFTQVPCSLFDFAGSSGQIPADECNDEWRLNPLFRADCGCPPLPPAPAPAPCFGATVPILGLLFKLICLIFRLFT
jgi:hypothetical protein